MLDLKPQIMVVFKQLAKEHVNSYAKALELERRQ